MIVRRRNAAGVPPDQSSGRLTEGATIAGYRIGHELERPIDSYNAFEAFTETPGERVVLKLIDKRLGEDERFAARLEDALERQSAIKHPAMVTVLAGGVAPEGLYVVSAMIRRPTLAAVLAAELEEVESGGLKPPRAMRMLSQLADVLEVAHRAGLVHGCLQTRSVRVGPDDEIFVDDFAMGRLRASKEHYAGPALLYGAPEQFAGEPPTPRSDVYGFAAVAYECLTGAVPYWHGAIAHDGKPPLPVQRHSGELPPELDEPFAHALSADPADRPATVSALTHELAGALVLWTEEPEARGASAPTASRASSREKRAPALDDLPEHTDIAVRDDRSAVAPSRATPASVGPASRRPRRLAFVLATAAVAVAATAAGIVLAGRDASKPPVELPKTMRSGSIELTAPPGWKRTAPTDPEGLAFAQKPIALAAPGGERAPSLMAGRVSAQGPTFVPRAVVASLIEPLPRPDLVTLGRARALRYSGVRLNGGRRVATLYSVPTSDGVALLSCSVPAGDPSAVRRLARCEQVAATLEIRGAQPVELVFSAEYGEVLTGVLTRLNKVRATERENLRFRGRQPEAARALALAYAEAGRKLAATDPPADAAMHEDIRRAFRRTRQAYAGLAAAARRRDRLGYQRARQTVNDGERDIEEALRALNTLGYAPG